MTKVLISDRIAQEAIEKLDFAQAEMVVRDLKQAGIIK